MAERDGFLAYIIAGREMRCSSVHAKCLVQYYCSNVGKDGKFFKSTLDICADTLLAPSTVRRLNERMKQLGVLSWVEGNNLKKLANQYTLHLPEMRKVIDRTEKFRAAAKEKAREQSAERSRRYREKKVAAAAAGVTQ